MLNEKPHGVLEMGKIPIPRIALQFYKDILYTAGTHKRAVEAVNYYLEGGDTDALAKNLEIYVPALEYIREHADEFAAVVAQMSPSLMVKADIKKLQTKTAVEITDVTEAKLARHPKSNWRSWFFSRHQ